YDVQLNELVERCGSTQIAQRAIPEASERQLVFAQFLERRHDVLGARAGYVRLVTSESGPEPGRLEALRALIRLGDPRTVELAQQLLRVSPLAADVGIAVASLRTKGRSDLADQAQVAALGRFPGDWSVVAPATDVLVRRSDLITAADALQK